MNYVRSIFSITLSAAVMLSCISVQTAPLSTTIAHFSPWGFADRQGDRRTMENAAIHEVDKDKALFGIFDGHGDRKIAGFAADHFRLFFHQDYLCFKDCWYYKLSPHSHFKDFFKFIFLLFDDCFANLKFGSTAAVAYRNGTDLYCAWVGDSRIVVGRQGKVIFATEDHKPNNPKEKKRIEAAGGRVVHWGVPRINGLTVSRTLGDHEMKNATPGAIIAEPDVEHMVLQEGDIIIIACDGVWDVLSNQEALDIVHMARQQEKCRLSLPLLTRLGAPDSKHEEHSKEHSCDGADLAYAACELRDAAYERGSHDNISVLVVQV